MKQQMSIALVITCLVMINLSGFGQTLKNGPMLGYCEMTEVAIWFQTTEAATVAVEYWPSGNSDDSMLSNIVRTTQENAFVAEITCRSLEPGTTYNYGIVIGDIMLEVEGMSFTTQSLWQYRTDPPEFSLVVGSCNYINEEKYDRPGKPYGGDYQIFETIANKDPNLMLWLGDNTYFREADLATWNGMLHRYTHTRSILELDRLMRTCHHYAIWDDHDYGPNDSNGSWIHKNRSQEAFELFWANNGYGFKDVECNAGTFTYADVDVFLLDNRTFRTNDKRKDITPQILGAEQIDWLVESLLTSSAPFKLVAVGGQFLSDFAKYENHAVYPEEQARLLNLIEENGIEGVIFLTGDRHHTELSGYEFADGRMIYDLTASPLTSSSYDHHDENNTRRIPKTIFCDRNFVSLNFSGERKDRTLTLECFDSDGKSQWNFDIHEDDLKGKGKR
jgi:alkaline phosphatase D